MKQLAFITQGHSEYDDRLWKLLDESGIDPHEFDGLDYFGLTPFFVIAGATVRADAHTHGPTVHTSGVYVEIPEELEDAFYATLPAILDSAYS
jgi:hypothetical protein